MGSTPGGAGEVRVKTTEDQHQPEANARWGSPVQHQPTARTHETVVRNSTDTSVSDVRSERDVNERLEGSPMRYSA